MVDTLTPTGRSVRMALVKASNTAPEKRVAAALRAAHVKFRRQARLPGRPDFLLIDLRIVIFVHGCFWHRHAGCSRTRTPKTRVPFWMSKFATNVARDRRVARELRQLGYSVHVIWECQTENPHVLASRIRRIRRIRRAKPHSPETILASKSPRRPSTLQRPF